MFFTEDVLEDLNITERKTSITVITMEIKINNSKAAEGLEVSNGISFDHENEIWLKLSIKYTRRNIPVNSNDVIKPEHLANLQYLGKVKAELCKKAQHEDRFTYCSQLFQIS